MITPRTKKQVAGTNITLLRMAYNELAEDYSLISENKKILCPYCGEWKRSSDFYTDNRTATGYYHMCKECVMEAALDYDKKTKTWIDNREKTIDVFKMLNLPFIETMYNDCLLKMESDSAEDKYSRSSAFKMCITMVKSLRHYSHLTWKDSIFISDSDTEKTTDNEEYDELADINRIDPKTIKNGRKRFGIGYSDEDYLFLENEYQEWVTRYECNTKAQEESFQRLSMKKLEIKKATLNGDSTDKLDATYQQWLTTANITPKQSASNSVTDAQTFGTLIQKFEETRPLPEIDPELKDIDKIGLIIDVFFKGHLAKMFGLKNNFTNIYEKFMKKYTVEPPQYIEEEDSESIFNKVFGGEVDLNG